MHFGFGDGSRVGAIVQAVIYLMGIPIFYDIINTHNDTLIETNGTDSSLAEAELPQLQGLAAEDEVCYESLGCFKSRYPDSKGYQLLPNPLEEIHPTICLYTKARMMACQVVENELITSSTITVSNGSNFWIAHGYIENGQRPWVKHLVDELLEYDNFANVFVIDWSEASKPPYNQAVENVELISAYCANLMEQMEETYELAVNETHFIGHSLGAQLGGFIGSWLQVNKNLHLGRISGLDPAQLYFQGLPIDSRLDPTDALFVDVIHTDAKPFLNGGELVVSKASPNISISSITLTKSCATHSVSTSRCSSMLHPLNLGPVTGLGTQEPSGHVDFYPNGGKDQPGCKDGVYQAILQEEGSVINGIRRFLGCDHLRSYEYFTESIRSTCPYMAFDCESWDDFVDSNCPVTGFNRLGFHATKPLNQSEISSNASILYYSITGPRQPFCREHYRVIVHLAEESKYRSTSELHLVLANDISGQSTVLNLGPTDFTDKGLERKYTVSGVNIELPNKLILRPSSSNPLRWLTSRVAPQAQPDVVVTEIKLLHLESKATEITFCPENGKNFFSGTEQDPSIVLRSDRCSS